MYWKEAQNDKYNLEPQWLRPHCILYASSETMQSVLLDDHTSLRYFSQYVQALWYYF